MTSPKDGPTFKGSELRDRMANERTLLAWVRSAIALMAFGIALSKFSLFLEIAAIEGSRAAAALPPAWASQTIGAGLIALGGVVAGMGLRRTLRYAEIIDPERKPPGHAALLAITIGVMVLALLLIADVLIL